MAKLFKVDGTVENVMPANGTDFTLEELQKMVGGLIQVVPVFRTKLIVVDEEGRLKNYKHNTIASLLVADQVKGDIVGDMLLCSRAEFK
jgi:hypothetical protein